VHQVHKGGFVREWRHNFVTPPTFEDEAGFGAVDTDLFDVWICKVFGKRAQRCHGGKDPPQQLLRLFAVNRRHGASLLFCNHPSDQLVNPGLVVDAYACEIAPCQLGRELGLDARADLKLNRSAIASGYRHASTAVPASG
jgi:hypothetical protein